MNGHRVGDIGAEEELSERECEPETQRVRGEQRAADEPATTAGRPAARPDQLDCPCVHEVDRVVEAGDHRGGLGDAHTRPLWAWAAYP